MQLYVIIYSSLYFYIQFSLDSLFFSKLHSTLLYFAFVEVKFACYFYIWFLIYKVICYRYLLGILLVVDVTRLVFLYWFSMDTFFFAKLLVTLLGIIFVMDVTNLAFLYILVFDFQWTDYSFQKLFAIP